MRATGENDTGSRIRVCFSDGPLGGSSVEVEPVEGRPPKTIDVSAADGVTYRYCLAQWVQTGAAANYEFLYPV